MGDIRCYIFLLQESERESLQEENSARNAVSIMPHHHRKDWLYEVPVAVELSQG